MIGRDVFLLDAVREASDDEVLDELPRAVLRARDVDPARGLRPGRASPRPPTSRRSSPSGAAARSTCAIPQRGEKRELHGPGHAQRRPRRSPASRRAGWPTRARPWPRSRSWPTRSACPGRRCASSATTSSTSRAASRSAAWSSSRTASRDRASTAGSGSRPSRARTTSPATRRCCAAGSARTKSGEEGSEEERRWAMPDLVIVDGGKGQVSAAKEVLDELGPARPAAGRPGQGARGAVPARTAPTRSCCRRRRRRCTSSSGCATRRTGSRSPTTARCATERTVRSAFDDLPGVGPKRKRELLKVFGSIKRVREAPVEQIAAVPGISRAAGGADQGARSRPDRAPASRRAASTRSASGGSVYHPAAYAQEPAPSSSSSSACSPSLDRLLPGPPPARLADSADGTGGRSRRSSGSTRGRPAGRVPGAPGGRRVARRPRRHGRHQGHHRAPGEHDRRVGAGRRRSRAPTGSSSSCRASPTPTPCAASSARPAGSTSCRSGTTQVDRGPGRSTSRQFPPLFSGDQVQSATVGPDQNGRPDGRLRARRADGRAAVRRLHGASTSASTSRSPSTARSISAPGHPERDPQRPGPDHRRRHRRLPGQGGQRTWSRS